MTKLWSKGYSVSEAVEAFTVGNDRVLDLALAKYDLRGSIAHAKMLRHIDILDREELAEILSILEDLLHQVEDGTFEIEEQFEDVHSKVEHVLTAQLGETGKKIHTGRSRNDQVLVDLHLYIKAEIEWLLKGIVSLFEELMTNARLNKDILIPGYTHLQVAMPSSFGLWFSAYAESLIDDVYLLQAAYKVANQNPLGSAAGYGTSIPLNRRMTTELLGFDTLKYNVVAAQMSRGKSEKAMSYALASLAGTISKLSMDVCLYMGQNFGFLSLPKEFTTGSSIMPHKKNPDVFELLRGKCNKIQALPYELTLLTNNLPSGYHREFQLLKEAFIPAIESMKDCLQMCTFMMGHLQVNEEAVNSSIYDYLYTVESVNELVMQGMPFREAYQIIGKAVEEGSYKPQGNPKHTHEGSIGNLCLEEISDKLKKALKA